MMKKSMPDEWFLRSSCISRVSGESKMSTFCAFDGDVYAADVSLAKRLKKIAGACVI